MWGQWRGSSDSSVRMLDHRGRRCIVADARLRTVEHMLEWLIVGARCQHRGQAIRRIGASGLRDTRVTAKVLFVRWYSRPS